MLKIDYVLARGFNLDAMKISQQVAGEVFFRGTTVGLYCLRTISRGKVGVVLMLTFNGVEDMVA